MAFGGAYLATRKKEDKKLAEGPKIQPATSDPEEKKFIEYVPCVVLAELGCWGVAVFCVGWMDGVDGRNFLKEAEKEGRRPDAAAHAH